ncbi:MAG TPA: GNAT family N-acetyltransferase [Acidimicrobiales bacterium]
MDPRIAVESDVDHIAAVLADAFFDDPIMAWALPDIEARPRRLQAMFGYVAQHVYIGHRRCQTSEEAVALWLPAGVTMGDEFWEEHGLPFAEALDGDVERLAALGNAMGEHHPGDPHLYLLAIGVRPSAQGRGHGGDLLAKALERADAEGEAAYLEATSPRSRVLYQRHGFEAVGEFSVDGSPPMWPMWRHPR